MFLILPHEELEDKYCLHYYGEIVGCGSLLDIWEMKVRVKFNVQNLQNNSQ